MSTPDRLATGVKTIDTLGDLRGKRVLVRSDFNVPLDGTTITDDGRIRAALPTLKALLDGGARVVVTAHLGRPKGAPEAKYSLAPVAARLSELLGQPGGNGCKGVLGLRRTLGAAEVRGHDDPCPAVEQGLQGGQGSPDPAVVGDGGAVERHVEVGADQDALSAQVAQCVDGLHAGCQSLRGGHDCVRVRRSPRRAACARGRMWVRCSGSELGAH